MTQLTKYLIYAVTAALVVYDFFAFFEAGGEATESTTVGTWMSRSLWVTFAVFLLAGHLLGSGPVLTWKMGVAAAAGAVCGLLLTRF